MKIFRIGKGRHTNGGCTVHRKFFYRQEHLDSSTIIQLTNLLKKIKYEAIQLRNSKIRGLMYLHLMQV